MTTDAVGQWTIGRAIDEPDTYLIGSGGVFWCRVVGGPHGSAEARACLMHAAPELLAYAECQGAIEEYAREGTDMKPRELLAVLRRHGWDRDDAAGCKRWIADLRRVALAKVRGAVEETPQVSIRRKSRLMGLGRTDFSDQDAEEMRRVLDNQRRRTEPSGSESPAESPAP